MDQRNSRQSVLTPAMLELLQLEWESSMKQITAGSFSRLQDFETCAYRAKLKYVDRVPESKPELPKNREHPLDRGSRIHDEAEQFVRGKLDGLPVDLTHFSTEFYQARSLFEQGLVETEEMWCFDENWNTVDPDDFKRIRFRIMCDLVVDLTPNHALVVDYKTGKRYNNEIKHEQQKTLYAIGLCRRRPHVSKVTTELWYLDLPHEDIFAAVLTRNQATVLLRAIDARNKRMLEATHFPPSANKYNCKWCPFNVKNREDGEEVCKYAI